MTTARTAKDFRKENDPTFKVDEPIVRLEREIPRGTDVYVITAAQNATPVEPHWWRILENIVQHRKGQMMVIPLRYKNPTSQWTGSQRNADYWNAEVRPYLWNVRKALNKNLMVLGQIKIQPTASSPLTGFDAISGSSSGIVGHTKMQLRSIAAPANRMAKILTTTGACTVANYTDSRAGRVGEFHHSLSAVIVEVDGPHFWLRQLHYDAKTRSCTDLETRYTESSVERAPRALALGMGDTHVRFIDPQVKRCTFGKGGIIDTLKPAHIIWADLLDGYSCNPHHKGNPYNRIAKVRSGYDDVRAETLEAIEFVRDNTPANTLSVIQASNHNDFLRRWINSTDWRDDPVNAEFYLETALAMARSTKMGDGGTEHADPFAYWFRQANVPNTRVLDLDESFSLADVSLDMHGDRGPNGSRGSIKNLRRVATKSIIEHGHSPGIDEGCYQGGTSTRLRLEYNHGASSWLNAHVLLNADGKRQIIIMVNGRYRK